MRMFFVGLLLLLVALSFDANAQFKPSEQQYLSEENLAVNGGFEQGKKSWTNANGTFSVDTAFKVLGNSSGKVELTAQTLDFSQTLTTGYNAALSGLQGQVSAYVKANFAFEVCALIDGAESNCLQGNTDNSFDFYQIPIVLGGTSLGIKFKSIGAVTGTIYIDGVSYGHKQFVQDIAQSELAFDVNIGTISGYSWSSAQSAYISPAPPDADMVINKASGETQIPCAGINPSNGLTCSSSAENYGVVFDAKIGEYEICADFSFYTTLGSFFTFQLVETPNNSQTIIQEGKGRAETGFDTGGTGGSIRPYVCGTFYFNTAGKKTIRLMFEKSGGGTGVFLTDRAPLSGQRDMHITGKYYPPKSKIVTQLQEETVQTANEFTAIINTGTGAVSNENISGWISAVNVATAGQIQIDVLGLGLTNPLNCTCVGVKTADNVNDSIDCNKNLNAVDTARYIHLISAQNITRAGANITVMCQKQGADYNKSRMVYGQFEQIKTKEVYHVTLQGTNGDTIDANIENIQWNEFSDPFSIWNEAGRYLEVPLDGAGFYSISGNVRFTAGLDPVMYIYVDQGSGFSQGHAVSGNIGAAQSHHIQGVVYLNAGDKLAIRTNTTGVLQNLVNLHNLVIKQEPDLAGIVKNLNDKSYQTIAYSGNGSQVSGVFRMSTAITGLTNEGSGIITYSDDGTIGTRITANKNCKIEIAFSAGGPSTVRGFFIRKNSNVMMQGTASVSAAADVGATSVTLRLAPNDYIDFYSPTTGFTNSRFVIYAETF